MRDTNGFDALFSSIAKSEERLRQLNDLLEAVNAVCTESQKLDIANRIGGAIHCYSGCEPRLDVRHA